MSVAPDPRPRTRWLENRRAATDRVPPYDDAGHRDPWTAHRPVLAAESLAAAVGVLPPAAAALAGVDALRAAWPHCRDEYERTRLAAAARIAMAAQAAPTLAPGPNFAPTATMTTPEV